MEVISPFEGLHDTFSIVPQEAEDTISDNNSNTSKLVTGLERSFALDTAAILGGDEYLIQQILEELQRLQYNKSEKNVLRWALTELWGDAATQKLFEDGNSQNSDEKYTGEERGPTNQKCLNSYFTEYNQIRLPRTLSTCLLYSGRHSDTKIYSNPSDHTQRYMLLNLQNYPYMHIPIGSVPDNSSELSSKKNRSCDKLAVIYVKLTYAKRRTSSNNFGTAPLTGLASAQSERLCYQNNERRKDAGVGRRKRSTSICQSYALEKGMLSRLHCVGVVPVP